MQTEEVKKLAEQVTAELETSLKQRAVIDDQIDELRAKRAQVSYAINNARAMLKFAELAQAQPAAIPDIGPTPVPKPVETAALEAAPAEA